MSTGLTAVTWIEVKQNHDCHGTVSGRSPEFCNMWWHVGFWILFFISFCCITSSLDMNTVTLQFLVLKICHLVWEARCFVVFVFVVCCIIVRWFLDASFHVLFWCIIVILERDTVIFGPQNLSFGRPAPPFLHFVGPWDDPGALGSTRKETLGSRLGFLFP